MTSRLLLQDLGTDWWLTFIRSDSHRLYSQHRTGAQPLRVFRIPTDRLL